VYVVALLEAISLKPEVLLVVEDCHLYSNVPVSPLAATLLVNAAGVNGLVPLCAAAMVPPEVGFTHAVTVISITLLATAPVQSLLQSTLANRLNQVVWVNAPAVYVAELLEAISMKFKLLLVMEYCHLYSIVPVCPLATTLLVNAAGVNGLVPLCAAAMVPPIVGFTHAVTVISITLLATAPVQFAEQDTLAKRLNQVVWVNAPAVYVAALLEVISLKPVVALVMDDCHLYSKVPVCPLAATLLVNAAGVNGLVPLCAAAMVPPEVGSTHTKAPLTVTSNTLLATAPVQSDEQDTLAKRLNQVFWVNAPAVYVAALL
jgi:hypothetical protein